MKQITLGIVGAGRIGKLHTENLIRIPNIRVKRIADPYIDETWAVSHGLDWSKQPEDVFADAEIDAVLILSPSPLHADHIIQAARANKHIFCEKPIALNPERIREALAEVSKAGVKLQIGFNRRFDPNFRRIKEDVDAGKIGQVYYIRITARDPAPPSTEYIRDSGGMFLDMTIHDFDMVRYLSSSEVEEVFAAGAVLADRAFAEVGDVDTAITTIRLKNGALAVIDNSRKAVYGYDQRIEVFGSKGSICAANETHTTTMLMTNEGVTTDRPLDFFLDRYQVSFQIEVEAFLQAILEDTNPPVSGMDGLKPILIGLAAMKSLKEGRPVKVE
ncbi:MAG: inositol 2-dehydrogenase [bacterium]